MGIEPTHSLKRSIKYVGTLCVVNMLNEVMIIKLRDKYLKRESKSIDLSSLSFQLTEKKGEKHRNIKEYIKETQTQQVAKEVK